MYNKNLFILLIVLLSAKVISQENRSDSIGMAPEKKWYLTLDISSRYLWRGQCWGGDYVAVQPTIEYAVTPKLTLGFWATTNFKSDYFYSDGVSAYKGYQELDFYLYYQVTDFLQLQLWDYYWPSVSRVEGVDNGYFNYGPNGSKTIDAILYFDFSEGYRYPFNATISTLVAGNDYRYDSNEENPRQNFTTYIELGYTYAMFENSRSKFWQNIDISPVVGAVLNNKAAYYTYADYNKVSWVNLGVGITKELELSNEITMPIALNYTHNAAAQNTGLFGQNFWVATLSLSY